MEVKTTRIKHICNNCGHKDCVQLQTRWMSVSDSHAFTVYKIKCIVCKLTGPQFENREKAVEGWFNKLIEVGAKY